MKFWPFGKKKTQQTVTAPCDNTVVPTHLKPYFVQRADKESKTHITGDIRCNCGCMVFAAHHSKDDDCIYRVTCADCQKEILLFDARRHGWDAIVCHMPGEYLQAGEENAVCPKCGGEHFHVTVWIEPTEKAEFVSCVEGELPESEWVNAFAWFAAHLTCDDCGCKQRDWADVETA